MTSAVIGGPLSYVNNGDIQSHFLRFRFNKWTEEDVYMTNETLRGLLAS